MTLSLTSESQTPISQLNSPSKCLTKYLKLNKIWMFCLPLLLFFSLLPIRNPASSMVIKLFKIREWDIQSHIKCCPFCFQQMYSALCPVPGLHASSHLPSPNDSTRADSHIHPLLSIPNTITHPLTPGSLWQNANTYLQVFNLCAHLNLPFTWLPIIFLK